MVFPDPACDLDAGDRQRMDAEHEAGRPVVAGGGGRAATQRRRGSHAGRLLGVSDRTNGQRGDDRASAERAIRHTNLDVLERCVYSGSCRNAAGRRNSLGVSSTVACSDATLRQT